MRFGGSGKEKGEFCETNGMERRGLRTIRRFNSFFNSVELGKLGPSLPSLTEFDRVY